MDGGVTSVGNLVLLCRRHHRAVHEGGFTVLRHEDGALTFRRPDGTILEAAPALPVSCSSVGASSADDLSVWDGTPFDLAWAIDVLYRPPIGS